MELTRRDCLIGLPSVLLSRNVQAPAESWRSLFDGKALGQWKSTPFGGEGEVRVEDGAIVLERGNDLTGVTWAGPLERIGYEIGVEARRVAGNDFFCGLTFPVGQASCSFIVGGWGGAVTGLSSLDGLDASENETTTVKNFEDQRWYAIRVRVTADRIQTWIDEAVWVDVKTSGRRIGIRPEVEASRPLGIASWRTTAALRNIRLRKV
jgi:hypothetical protein